MQKLVAQYGSESSGAQNLAEVLTRNGTPPFWVTTHLEKGEELRGEKNPLGGNERGYIDYWTDQLNSRPLLYIGGRNLCFETVREMENSLREVVSKEKLLWCFLYQNRLGQNQALLGFQYTPIPPEGRGNSITSIVFFLPNNLGKEAFELLRGLNPHQTVLEVQRLIDPTFPKIPPQFEATVLGYRQVDNGPIQVEKIAH